MPMTLKVEHPMGFIVKGKEAHADFLKEWFATSNPFSSWKFNYAMANDVIQADGSADHWVTSLYTVTETIDGEEVAREEMFDVQIENGKIKNIMVMHQEQLSLKSDGIRMTRAPLFKGAFLN